MKNLCPKHTWSRVCPPPDEKPHSCEHCSLNFRRKDNLNRHIMNHHTNEHGEPIVPWEIAETTEKDKPVAEDSIGSTGKKRAKAKAGENLSSAKPNKPKSKPKKTKRSSSVSSAKSSAKLARVRDKHNSWKLTFVEALEN